ncbi:DUF805 domain-containing protein [Macrococcus sp. DPC7161]|uniref:DUF805 domain-containing protein n=1 Tax=Macrococcus sp. DPC7161 TaxID=2507060 RepID=UPI00100A3C9F|nr:DUF805 domain-containing protein [Macrococcus sp. DPC7161]RXK17879.1 DUF805 domain-containing protein [Macrococcus sp. DPC7161]
MIPKMTMGEAFKRFWINGLVFTGRSRRREYWLSMLANLFILIPLFILMGFLISGFGVSERLMDGIASIIGLIFLVPGTAMMVRRFHDVNLTGKIPVIFAILYGIYLILDATPLSNNMSFIITTGLINFVTGLFEFIVTCIDGTAGPNKYGEDPKRMIVG